MKKILLCIMVVVLAVVLCGCGKQATEDSDNYGFFVGCGKTYGGLSGETCFMYDPYTLIVYVRVLSGYKAGISVYYTIVDGKPEIARYGVNWIEPKARSPTQ